MKLPIALSGALRSFKVMAVYVDLHREISFDASFIASAWLVDRRFMLGDRDMKFLAIGAMQMSANEADKDFWAFVSDSCEFYN